MQVISGTEIQVINPIHQEKKIKQAVFDFDGTVSLLREGWEKIMAPVCVESICGDRVATPAIIEQVRRFIDDTTGVQTILQMEGLVKMVQEFGLVAKDEILDAWGYKRIYNDRLMVPVRQRIAELDAGIKTIKEFTLNGSVEFCRMMSSQQVTMYLASGTDQDDVRNEAAVLGVSPYFLGGIYGAIGSVEEYSKDKVIKGILKDHGLHGTELVVIGDGPVEIRNAKGNGAIAVGVASDEVTGHGWNSRKRERLLKAGCDILIPDFADGPILMALLNGLETPPLVYFD